jgi:hypothetical protein
MGLSFAVVAVFSLLAMAFFMAQSPNVSAATDPKYVMGYVKDSADRVLVGASIVVNMKDSGNTTVLFSKSGTTNGAGFYSLGFLPTEWNVGDIIEVISDYSGNQIKVYSAATLLTLPFNHWANITYPYEIPEFGSTVGLIIGGVAIGVVGAVFLVIRKRKN